MEIMDFSNLSFVTVLSSQTPSTISSTLCANTNCLHMRYQKVVLDLLHDVVLVAKATAFSHRKSLLNLSWKNHNVQQKMVTQSMMLKKLSSGIINHSDHNRLNRKANTLWNPTYKQLWPQLSKNTTTVNLTAIFRSILHGCIAKITIQNFATAFLQEKLSYRVFVLQTNEAAAWQPALTY